MKGGQEASCSQRNFPEPAGELQQCHCLTKPVIPLSVTKAGDNAYRQLEITSHTTDPAMVCCGIEAAGWHLYPSCWQATKLAWAWEVCKMHASWASVYRKLFILLLKYVFSTFFPNSLHFLKNRTKQKPSTSYGGNPSNSSYKQPGPSWLHTEGKLQGPHCHLLEEMRICKGRSRKGGSLRKVSRVSDF